VLHGLSCRAFGWFESRIQQKKDGFLLTMVATHSVTSDVIENETVMRPGHTWRLELDERPGVLFVTETDELLRHNNELLRELVAEVKKILREMQTMNEITQKRLPYRWVPGSEAKNQKQTNNK